MNKRLSLFWVLLFAFTMGNSAFAFDLSGFGKAFMDAFFPTFEEADFEDGKDTFDEQKKEEAHPGMLGDERIIVIKQAGSDAMVMDSKKTDEPNTETISTASLDAFKTWGITESVMHHMVDTNNEKYEDAKKKHGENPSRPLIAHIVTAYQMDWKSLVSLGASDEDGFKPDDVMFVCRKREYPHKGRTKVSPELFEYFMKALKKANKHHLITSPALTVEGFFSWGQNEERRSVLLEIIEKGYINSFSDILKMFPNILAELSTKSAYRQKQNAEKLADVSEDITIVDWLMRSYEYGVFSTTMKPHGFLDRKHNPKSEYIKAAAAIAALLLVDYPQSKLDGKVFGMLALLARQGDLPQDATLRMAIAQLDNLDGFDITSVPEDQREEIASNLSGDLKQKFEKLRGSKE